MGSRETPDQLNLANSLFELANVYRRQGRYDEALPLCERARALRVQALGPDDPLVAGADNTLAALAWNRGDYAEAEAALPAGAGGVASGPTATTTPTWPRA